MNKKKLFTGLGTLMVLCSTVLVTHTTPKISESVSNISYDLVVKPSKGLDYGLSVTGPAQHGAKVEIISGYQSGYDVLGWSASKLIIYGETGWTVGLVAV